MTAQLHGVYVAIRFATPDRIANLIDIHGVLETLHNIVGATVASRCVSKNKGKDRSGQREITWGWRMAWGWW